MAAPVHQLEIFYDDLAYKPYCAEYLDRGLDILPKREAIKRRYIQGNQPCMVNYLFFDLDHADSVLAWHTENLPIPYWTARNPENGHCHICYKLETPFPTTEIASIKPIRYASAIQAAYAKKLGSDTAYSRLITKNPLNRHWDVVFWSEKTYSLDYLADFVELPKKLSKKQEVSGLGRNCTMFNTVRKWAYTAVRAHRGGIYNTWLEEVTKQCLSVNEAFLEALPYSEIKATAKSIAEYCWKKDAYCYQEFVDRQSRKGAIGGKKSKRLPVDGSEASTKPWESMGISRATFYRRKK